MQVDILSSNVSDNTFYLVHDGEHAALIDPIDAATAIEAVERSGAQLDVVVNTHWHPDHVGGNDAVLDHFPDARLVSGPDHAQISSEHEVDEVLTHGDVLKVGDVELETLETPGHTAGHISLLGDGHLFSGDTIFVGGAGNCRFGGDPSVLFRTFRDVIGSLDGSTKFYPGHDYAKRNVEFALSLEPAQTEAREMLERISDYDGPIFLTNLESERAYNPFFRADDDALQTALRAAHGEVWDRERAASEDDAEATFRAVRELRNSW